MTTRMTTMTTIVLLLGLAAPAAAADFYVSSDRGDNGAPGTKGQPFKNIDIAVQKASVGDTIHVAGGVYFGVRGKGYIELDKPVTLLGGYSGDFARRDPLANPTLVQPSQESAGKSRRPLMILNKSKAGERLKIDGIVFDMGQRNAYHPREGKPEGVDSGRLLLPTESSVGQKPTVTEPCLSITNPAAAGDVLVQNSVFVNCASFGIQAAHKQGSFKVLNNVFVANRMAAVEIFGTGGRKGPKGPIAKDGDVEVAHNTILFTWSRLKDLGDMGYGVRVMTLLSYNIHHNVIGGSVFAGVDHTRFNRNEWIKVDDNVFFANKQADLMFSEPGNVQLERVKVKDFGDLGLASARGNKELVPKLPLDMDYLKGFLGVSYTEQADYNPNSAANRWREAMGLNKQGKLTTSVSMYANRYPWRGALKLFGALAGSGAQPVR